MDAFFCRLYLGFIYIHILGMNKVVLFILMFIGANYVSGQEQNLRSIDADSLYREDQFYVGVTYNLLGERPLDLKQNGFSLGFHFGFIRDIPINKKRNIALGLGFGYSSNSFNNNLFIEGDNDLGYRYSIIDETIVAFSKNKLTQHLLEVPIEFRWRTSNTKDYNFWRIYWGVKIGYVIRNSAKFVGEPSNIKHVNINDFNDFQYGLNLSLGYNTWNLYFYYGLNPIFSKNTQLNNIGIEMNAIKVGLMFYIL